MAGGGAAEDQPPTLRVNVLSSSDNWEFYQLHTPQMLEKPAKFLNAPEVVNPFILQKSLTP